MNEQLLRLEGAPTDEQKERLDNWLSELKIICRQYGLLLDTDDGDTRIVDLYAHTIIGVGLTYLTTGNSHDTITAYDCSGSILDGSWLIDTRAGPIEQRLLGPVFPHRPHHEGR